MVKTLKDFAPADRYLYDFHYCTYAKGWAQIDTRQDASYYGNWTNPYKLEIFSYVEGDLFHTKCDTVEEYRAELQKVFDWNKKAGYWLGIDLGLNPDMERRFLELDLGHLFHHV